MTAYRWRWTAPIERATLPALQDLAKELGFIVTGNNAFTGSPSPADFLDALATVYRLDPAAARSALAGLLDAAGLLPSSDDAT